MAETQENGPNLSEQPVASAISEDAIKRAVVPFLRNFYKNRYAISYGTERADFDLVDAAGHQVDSRIIFNKEDGAPFTCAVEATSADKLDEVRFSLNLPYFIWACFASTSFTMGILYLFLWRFRGEWVYKLGWQGNLGLVLVLAGVLYTVYYFLNKRREKFRYIYAVEQFKSYQADEKWVALAENAFPEPDNIYLAELRKQLIFNGYGLVLVSDEGMVKPLITPSRLGAFGEKRKAFEYFLDSDFIWKGYQLTQSKPAQMLGTLTKKGWKLTRADRLTDPTQRYMRSFFHQKLLTGIGICIVGLVVWRTRSYRAVDFMDEKDRAALLKTESTYEGESYLPGDHIYFEKKPPNYLPDAPAPEPDLSGEPNLEKPESDADFFEKLSGRPTAAQVPVAVKSPILRENAPKRQVISPKTIAGCEKWSGKKGWVVQDNFFGDLDFAKERLAILTKNGFQGELVKRQCLYENQSGGWVILLNGVFSGEKTARSTAADLQKKLAKLKLDRKPVLVKKLME